MNHHQTGQHGFAGEFADGGAVGYFGGGASRLDFAVAQDDGLIFERRMAEAVNHAGVGEGDDGARTAMTIGGGLGGETAGGKQGEGEEDGLEFHGQGSGEP